MHPKRNEAIAMRHRGASFSEITKALNIGKSTLSYMLKDVELTEVQEARLAGKIRANQIRMVKQNAALPVGVKKARAIARGKLGGTRSQELHGERLWANLGGGYVGSMAYRKDELPIKVKLEKIYGRAFSKEKIGNRYVDFACEDMIIEHTIDASHGLFDLVRRMEDIASDPRKKIAYIDTARLGPKNSARLSKAVDVVLDYRSIV